MKYDINSINKRKKIMEVVHKILGVILIIFIYNMVLTLISSEKFNNGVDILGYKSYIITSDSMEPAIHYGDLIIIKKRKQDKLQVGDIITFKQNYEFITHRIIEIEDDSQNKEKMYITKGDNNNIEDIEKTIYSNIQGKYILKIPQLGKIMLRLNDKIIILIIMLILLILLLCKIRKQEKIEIRRAKKEIEDNKNTKNQI